MMPPQTHPSHRLARKPLSRLPMRRGWTSAIALVATVPAVSLLSACIELPDVPRFETDLFVPLGRERASGWDLVEDNEFVFGDSSGVEPLQFRVRGDVDTFRVGELLDLDAPGGEFDASLEHIEFDPPEDVNERFTIGDLTDAIPIGLPEKIQVPPFVIPVLREPLPAQDAFSWIRFADGAVRFRLQNDLPVPIGVANSPEVAFGIRLRDRVSNRLIAETEFRGRILPGQSTSRTVFLEDVEVESLMDLEIWGRSEGSADPVEIDLSQGVEVHAEFFDVEPDSVVAEVEAQSLSLSGEVEFDLGEDLAVYGGSVASGTIPVRIENDLPLAATGDLVFPDISLDGEPLGLRVTLPAGRPEGPGTFQAALGLAGAEIASNDGLPIESIRYQLEVRTEGSVGVVELGRGLEVRGLLQESPLSFEWVEAESRGSTLDVPASVETIDPPEAIEDVGFQRASIRLEVESTVPLPADASVQVRGFPEAGGSPIEIPIDFTVLPSAGGPATTVHVVDQTEAPLLELIEVRPVRLEIDGTVLLGAPDLRAILHRDDWIRGSYEFGAPFEVRLDGVEYESDVFDFEIGEDAQERIREDVLRVQAEGVVENHFPASVELQLRFASSPERLDEDPEVVVETVVLASAEVDPKSGLVVAPVTSPFDVSLDRENISFFARDQVYARFVFLFDSPGKNAVLVMADDYAEARAMLRFSVEVRNP